MGATFAGQINTADKSEATDLINILQRDVNPALQTIYNRGIAQKKDVAIQDLNQLLLTKDAETIQKEILEGKHPNLSGKYIDKTVQYHTGRHQAVDAIAKIEENKNKYNFQENNLPAFYKEYLPSFADKDGSYALGFASVFNQYKAKEAIADSQVRNNYAQTKKIEEGVKILSASDVTDVWATANSLNIALPPEEGEKTTRYMYSNEEVNNVVLAYAQDLYNNATSTDDIDKAIKILSSDRGIGKNGMKLGSLIDTKRKDVSETVFKLNNKRVTLENQNRINEEYKEKKEIQQIFSEAFSDNQDGSPKTFSQRKDLREKLEKFGTPQLLSSFDNIMNVNRFADVDPVVTDKFMVDILLGQYDNLDELITAFDKENIPTSELTKAIGYFDKHISNSEKGIKPIHIANSTYSSQLTLIQNAVKGNFTTNGILKSNGAQAIFNSTNYIITEIDSFEDNFIKENGKLPNNSDRRKFMKELGDYVITTFKDEVAPEIMTMTEKEQSDLETQRRIEQQQEMMQEQTQNIITNINTITSNINEQLKTLPKYEDTGISDKLTPFTNEETEFKTKQLNNFIKLSLPTALNVEIDSNFVDYLSKNRDTFTPVLTQLAQTYGVDVNNLLELIKQISVGK
jgi:cation transport regulator ChaB